MNIAVISDLHLAPGKMNRCSVPKNQIDRWLDLLEATHDTIVVAGDLYDLRRPPLPGAWKQHLESIRFQWGETLQRLESYDAVFGNHDAQRAQLGIPERRLIPTPNGNILILHGHQFDPKIKQIKALETTANFAAGWFVRAGLKPLAQAMAHVAAINESLESQFAGDDLATRGAQSLLHHDVKLVVMGHTHRLQTTPLQNGTFANSGSWTLGHAEWLSINLQTLQTRLFRDGAHVIS